MKEYFDLFGKIMKEYFDIDKNPAGCRCCYKTPDGFDNIILTGDGSNINTLRFDRQNTYHESFGINELPVFYDAVQWLEQYFSGRKPEPFPYIKLNGCTGFRRTVIDLLAEVPYGQICLPKFLTDRRFRTANWP